MPKRSSIGCIAFTSRLMKEYDEPDRTKMLKIVIAEWTRWLRIRFRSQRALLYIVVQDIPLKSRNITFSYRDQKEILRRIRRKYVKVN